MAESRHPTPEKQLLNLIERPGLKDIEKKQKERQGKGLFSLGLFKGRLSYLTEQLKKKFAASSQTLDLKRVNKVLKIAIALLIGYLAINFNFNYQKIRERNLLLKNSESKKDKPLAMPVTGISEELSQKKDLPFYLDTIKRRNIFKFGVVEVKQEKDDSALAKITKLAEGLKLVGISFTDYPEAMIESERESKTYFAKKGDFVRQLEVKKIFKDYIVLEYEGQEYNLR